MYGGGSQKLVRYKPGMKDIFRVMEMFCILTLDGSYIG